MIVFRAKNPVVVHSIKNELSSITAEELCERMVVLPDRTYVAIVVDGDDVIGHTVVSISKDSKFAYVLSTNISYKVSREVRDYNLEKIEKWCIEEFNIHEIRTSTKVEPRVFERLYKGFKYFDATMSKKF